MNICGVKMVLGVAAGGFALVAAVFWFIASWKGFHTATEINRDLATQSRLNAAAAFFAGAAALLQIPLVWMPTCWG
jgi:hypothetical protein